jgi:tetratricopeptide (TPR) repeat protein
MIVVLAGCTSWPVGRSVALKEQGDRLIAEGQYAAAVRAYDEFLARYPDNHEAPRVLARRDAIAGLLGAREEIARLQGELGVRDGELGRLRQEIARLTAESERLRSEADRLRADLEKLKRLDIELERRRR